MRVEDYDYHLPEGLIAQKPADRRDESRLMCLDRESGEIEEIVFKEILERLRPNDLLVLNDSRVIPARLFGEKEPTGTTIEILLLDELGENKWEVLVKPGRRAKKGVEISFGDGLMWGRVKEYTDFGGRVMEFDCEGEFENVINRLGKLPLPPYIKEDLDNPERYQTVYAKKKGSVAAPTAGLHFTRELLDKIRDKGVGVEYITLHVGLGTFRPVREERVEDHEMHAEYYELGEETARKINRCQQKEGRVLAVGTTVTRTLEGVARKNGEIKPDKGWTDIFIYPGFDFRVIDGLITNFHLPRSTLLMLVSAFAGREKVLRAYREAVEREFRFYSLGDAMYIF
ncbi:MAG: tRNA preQ1(34) S-adenosylmethionine ribosyltransferase-isomerase QueA [Halanaerobiaceae bacterium]